MNSTNVMTVPISDSREAETAGVSKPMGCAINHPSAYNVGIRAIAVTQRG